jgi:hypothetical protein
MKFNMPDKIIADLANDPARLEKFSKLNAHQQAVEAARMESRYASHGHVQTGAEPAWRSTHKNSGRVSDSDWKSNFGAGLSDAAWNREFDRRQKLKPIR